MFCFSSFLPLYSRSTYLDNRAFIFKKRLYSDFKINILIIVGAIICMSLYTNIKYLVLYSIITLSKKGVPTFRCPVMRADQYSSKYANKCDFQNHMN